MLDESKKNILMDLEAFSSWKFLSINVFLNMTLSIISELSWNWNLIVVEETWPRHRVTGDLAQNAHKILMRLSKNVHHIVTDSRECLVSHDSLRDT